MPLKHKRLNKAMEDTSARLNQFLLMLRSYLLTGILVLVPLAVTIYIMFAVFQVADGMLGNAIGRFIGFKMPGMGLILTAAFCISVGVIAQNYFGRRFLTAIENSLERIPVVRSVYNGIKQVADVVLKKNQEFKRVVMLEYPKENCWVLGFVTADFAVSVENEMLNKAIMVTVFVPTTPNPTSGFLLIIEKSKIFDVNVDIEDAMKIIISGGLVQPARSNEPENTRDSKDSHISKNIIEET